MTKSEQEPKRDGRSTILVVALVGVSITFISVSPEFFLSRLFPYGFPAPLAIADRPTYSEVDMMNDKLRFKHGKLQKIYERANEGGNGEGRLLRSAETVVFGPDGTMYTATDQGYLISLTDLVVESPERITAKTTVVKDLGPGRPLGAKFTPHGNTLYIADAVLGLLRVQDPSNSDSKVEIVASEVMEGGRRTRLSLADDLVIGPKTGRVYFTDGKQYTDFLFQTGTFIVVLASLLELNLCLKGIVSVCFQPLRYLHQEMPISPMTCLTHRRLIP
jgi:hypothetical protein